MLEYFPQLMEGLFKLLGDEHREIRTVCFDHSYDVGNGLCSRILFI